MFKKLILHQKLKKQNALELVPVAKVEHEIGSNGNVVLLVKRFRFEFLYQVFGRSRHFKVRLDTTGSATWLLINGNRSIEEISVALAEQSIGDENITERIVAFITDLYRKELIQLKVES